MPGYDPPKNRGPDPKIGGPSAGQFIPVILAFRASLVLMYWPFGPVCSSCTGPLGQFCLDVLALRASLVQMYWPFGPV